VRAASHYHKDLHISMNFVHADRDGPTTSLPILNFSISRNVGSQPQQQAVSKLHSSESTPPSLLHTKSGVPRGDLHTCLEKRTESGRNSAALNGGQHHGSYLESPTVSKGSFGCLLDAIPKFIPFLPECKLSKAPIDTVEAPALRDLPFKFSHGFCHGRITASNVRPAVRI
jgi:hypothetical protein